MVIFGVCNFMFVRLFVMDFKELFGKIVVVVDLGKNLIMIVGYYNIVFEFD